MLLSWGKPKQVKSKEEWASLTADGAPPGVYQPNMSEDDRQKWKAKHIRGALHRVEIRNRGGKAGDLVVLAGDGEALAPRMLGRLYSQF